MAVDPETYWNIIVSRENYVQYQRPFKQYTKSQKKKPYLVGQQFGKLLILEYLGQNIRFESVWLCACDCGMQTTASTHLLNKGRRISCGCSKTEILRKASKKRHAHAWDDPELPILLNIYKSYKKNGKNREFTLSFEEFKVLIFQNCTYCGEPPSNNREYCGRYLKYTGIDRIDSSLGYVQGNVTPCCFKCNYAKTDMSLEEFRNYVKRLISYAHNWVNNE